jgi:hypothetical protein
MIENTDTSFLKTSLPANKADLISEKLKTMAGIEPDE